MLQYRQLKQHISICSTKDSVCVCVRLPTQASELQMENCNQNSTDQRLQVDTEKKF